MKDLCDRVTGTRPYPMSDVEYGEHLRTIRKCRDWSQERRGAVQGYRVLFL